MTDFLFQRGKRGKTEKTGVGVFRFSALSALKKLFLNTV